MVSEDAVLDDHMVIRLEKASLTVVFVDHSLPVVLQQLTQARVAVDGRPTIAVNHRGITSGDAAALADSRARVDVTAVEHDIQRLIHGEPVVGDAYWSGFIQTQGAAVAQLPGAPIVPDVVFRLDPVQ